MVPNGAVRFSIRNPLSSTPDDNTLPIGSGWPSTVRMAAIMPSILALSITRRSYNARSSRVNASRSRWFAVNIASRLSLMIVAIDNSTWFFCVVVSNFIGLLLFGNFCSCCFAEYDVGDDIVFFSFCNKSGDILPCRMFRDPQFRSHTPASAGFALIRLPDVLLHGLVYGEVRNQFAAGVVGMAVEQPVRVGKQDQHVGMDQFCYQARQFVVVGKCRHR